MSKKEQKKNIMSGKGFYVAAVLAFCAIIGSVIAVHYTSQRLTDEISNLTSYRYSTNHLATNAQNEVENVPDTRTTENEMTSEKETETQKQTEESVSTTETVTAGIVNSDFILPLKETRIMKGYSPKSPVFSKTMDDWRTHDGIDFEAAEGEEVLSVGNGIVTKVVSDSKWGYIIEVNHGTFTGRYCSIDQENAVGIGTELKCGDVIGRVSSVPVESADEPHLHFEAIKDGKATDPLVALEKLQ